MARYIDADELLQKLPNDLPYKASVKRVLIQAPAADVVEVKHGEWRIYEDESLICATEFVCSVCKESFCSGELTDKEMREMLKYCPNCGAKMDGGKAE